MKNPSFVAGGVQQEPTAQFTASDLAALPASWLPALLPIGPDKRPLDPAKGSGKEWNNWPAFTTEALALAPAIGLRLGQISGGTLALDFDGPEAETTFLDLFGRPSSALPRSISWTSGKPHRRQIAFKVPKQRWAELEHRKAKVGALEFRWAGQQSVILGAHPETSGYRWVEGCAPWEVDPWEVELAEAPNWLLDLMPRKGAPPAPTLPREAQPRVMGASVPFRDFLSREAAELIDTGSTAGNCNDDGVKLSLELVAVETWLGQQGARPDETARDAYTAYLSNCPETINGEPFDQRKAWHRFDGAEAKKPTPATPECKLLERLRYHTRGSSPSGGGIGAPPWGPYRPLGGPVAWQATGNGDGDGPQSEAAPKGAAERTFCELLADALAAVRNHDDDAEMTIRAECMARFRRTDSQITAALFTALTEAESGNTNRATYRDLDLSKITPMEWLLEGFIPANDLTLLYGAAGTGKTTAALAAAFAVINGTGFLDRDSPADRGRVLFIASDSGAAPLLTSLHSLDLAGHPALADGDEHCFRVWAHDPGQGAVAWDASLRGCLALLDTVRKQGISLVMIDSCKAVTSKSGLEYTDNRQVSALLTFMKEVICQHCAVVLLNHDGVAKDATAGAKAWKEIPSMVHSIELIPVEDSDGRKRSTDSGMFACSVIQRKWTVKKCRIPGITREFRYSLDHESGQLQLDHMAERVADCRAGVVEVLKQAWRDGDASLSRKVIVERCKVQWNYSRKSVDNSLGRLVAARHQEVVRVPSLRGHYRLAPRLAQEASPVRGAKVKGKEQVKIPVSDSGWVSSLDVPSGNSKGNSPTDCEFPWELEGNSPDPSQGVRSSPVSSHRDAHLACAGEELTPTTPELVQQGGDSDTPLSEQSHPSPAPAGGIQTVVDLVRRALGQLRLAAGPAAVDPVSYHLRKQGHTPTRSQVVIAMQTMREAEADEEPQLGLEGI